MVDPRPKSWIDFGKRIRAARRAKGWTQQFLAENIGTSDREVRFWESGQRTIPLNLTKTFLRVLDFSESDLRAAYGDRTPHLENAEKGYRMCSFAEAVEITGSFEALDDAFRRIEDSFPVPVEEGEYGDEDKWVKLLRTTPETGGCLLHQEQEIVGYWQCFVVENDFYKRIISGENVNSAITTDDVVIVGEEGNEFNLFFISLFVEDKHLSPNLNFMIFEHFASFLLNSARAGMFFRRIAANITGLRARTLCRRRGFKKVLSHDVHRYPITEGGGPAEVFELNIESQPSSIFNSDSQLNKELRRSYEDAGIFPAR